MTDFEHYGRIFADISAFIGDAGKVSVHKMFNVPGNPRDTVVIVTTLKYPKSEPVFVDSCFNEIRRLAGETAEVKSTTEPDQQNGRKFVVRITASFRT